MTPLPEQSDSHPSSFHAELITSFLNHGVMPFVGRAGEFQQLLQFWRGTLQAHGVRAALLTGEAGIGKSRLMEELMPHIAREGGTVVHIRFYPESAINPAHLLADALWGSASAREIVRDPAPEDLPGCIAALRRLVRLRPTVLVVEDLHLLVGDALRDFTAILASLSDEPLSVIGTTRPTPLPAAGILAPYLVEELELHGIDQPGIQQLWIALFNAPPSPEVMDLLQEGTRGNALAVRSALRRALSSGAVERSSGHWQVSAPAFASVVERSVDMLSVGMTAHLREEERATVQMLAWLGEVFARETAEALLGENARLLNQLLFKGILATISNAPRPLPGSESTHPLLAFTHTLLHRQLTDAAQPDIPRLLEILADGLPLYSVLPWRILASYQFPTLRLDSQQLQRAITRGLATARHIEQGTDWRNSAVPFQAVAAIVAARAAEWPEEEWLRLITELYYYRLMLLRRDSPNNSEPAVEGFLRLTKPAMEAATPPILRAQRLIALRFLYRLCWERDRDVRNDVYEEAESLVAAYPELLYSQAYATFLSYPTSVAAQRADKQTCRLIEARAQQVIASEHCTPQVRRQLNDSVFRYLMQYYSDAEEYQRRLKQLQEFEDEGMNDYLLRHFKLLLLFEGGMMEQMMDPARTYAAEMHRRGMLINYFDVRMRTLCARNAMGLPFAALLQEAEQVFAEIPKNHHIRLEGQLSFLMMLTACFNNRPADGVALLNRVSPEWPATFPTLLLTALMTDSPFPQNAAQLLDDPLFSIDAMSTLAKYVVNHNQAHWQAARTALQQVYAEPIYSVKIVMYYLTAIELTWRAERNNLGLDATQQLRQGIDMVMEWMTENQLTGWARPLLQRYAPAMAKSAARAWDQKIAAIEQTRTAPPTEQPTAPQPLRITMLGAITVARPGGPAQPISGARSRALLGLMVADHMQRRRLDRQEFWRIAGGGGNDDDLEHSRKAMNQGILRLREAITREAVKTDSETPTLNFDLVQVDLLQAVQSLREADAAARTSAWMRASAAAMRALEISRGEVPFPTLYDNFFEATREDFEDQLRSTTLRVARGLLREGDTASAEGILTRLHEIIPEDEEAAQLLQNALIALGRRAEAERVRMRGEG
ncbi:MAG: AAA family ATPase [Armatimonadetes bacterium]|nr:AAA family ATPase [Armatimonadota bacterium]